MDCSTPSFPVHHQLSELAQVHVHHIGDAIQPSNPLWSPSGPAFKFSQHLDLLQWVSFLHQVARGLHLQLQHQSFQWIFRTDFLWIVWYDYLAAQWTLKSLLQHHSSKASVLRHSACCMVQLLATPWTAEHQATLSFTNSWSVHKLMSITLVMPSNHLSLCHPLLLLPSTFRESGSFQMS